MTAESPRVLILSDEGPQTGTAGGLLLHRLFRHHEPAALRVLARHVPTIGDALPGVDYRRLLIPWHRFESSRFHRLKRSLRAWHATPALPIGRVDALLGPFRPDVVVCVMQHAQYYDTAAQYARARGLPLVVLVHDVNDEFEPVYGWARRAALRRDAAFYRQAARRLCISPEMERLCAEIYGVPGDVLYPNRSEELQSRPLEVAASLRRPGQLTIGFAGNLNYGYGTALCQCLDVLRETRTRLVLYSRPPGPECAALAEATDVCEFRGFVPAAEAWAGLQRDCDAVWLPYPDPAGDMERLYRHHFPSKLPEYLALGMPVLVTGPDFATGMRWAAAQEEGTLARASGADRAGLAAILRRLAADHGWRQGLASRGLLAGKRDFDPAEIRRQFYLHLRGAVAAAPRPCPH